MAEERIEVSIEEAARIGIAFLQRGQVRDAEVLFTKLLSIAPRQPDALHYSGIVAHKLGRTEEGIARVRESLDLAPEQADWHSNLGILLENGGDGEGAIEAFSRAIALDPSHANAHNNLGVLQRLFGRPAEAEASYRAAIEINPKHADAYRNLALVLEQTGRSHDALNAYYRAVTIEPGHSATRRLLAVAYNTIGDRERAVEFCEEWVKAEPNDPLARHTLAACSQRDVPARASDQFVVASFDTFAATFEAKLTRLEYKAPSLVVASLAETGTPADKQLDILDAGCGTGWCGPLLAPYARRLSGVDLSAGMLEHARAKGVYDELSHAELVGYLQGQSGAFDIIVSADTLVYFGSLEPFAAAASAALRPGGWVIFTVEESKPATDTFHLEVHGRYNHAATYVEAVLGAAGLTPHIDRAVLRNESGLPVAGLVVRARKAMGDDRG
ncbi:putative S-adenosylmethionine-dependent methyltransferase [Luteitalea pratensis]|uniref:Putative S-adenosylmethionine-dependent methyltransferase n=2 Tax=Luteitalea pratensis TaxID=1855912 RepID=A0A143PIP3_LUTPR|nr:putative S-adenosylmethionine-dependent methyltransferase [Luteitalea pratensis]